MCDQSQTSARVVKEVVAPAKNKTPDLAEELLAPRQVIKALPAASSPQLPKLEVTALPKVPLLPALNAEKVAQIVSDYAQFVETHKAAHGNKKTEESKLRSSQVLRDLAPLVLNRELKDEELNPANKGNTIITIIKATKAVCANIKAIQIPSTWTETWNQIH